MVVSLPPLWVTTRCAFGYMLENPSIQRYLQEMGSKNRTSTL